MKTKTKAKMKTKTKNNENENTNENKNENKNENSDDVKAQDLFGSQIPVTTAGIELRASCIRSCYLTH